MKIKSILFLSSFILFSISALAQTGKVSGVVTDSAGLPVAGASIVLRDKSTRDERSVVTNGNGEFSFETGCSASCEVIVKANGFGATSVDVPSPGSPLAITIQPQPLKEEVQRQVREIFLHAVT